jgi:hypothetical protein
LIPRGPLHVRLLKLRVRQVLYHLECSHSVIAGPLLGALRAPVSRR